MKPDRSAENLGGLQNSRKQSVIRVKISCAKAGKGAKKQVLDGFSCVKHKQAQYKSSCTLLKTSQEITFTTLQLQRKKTSQASEMKSFVALILVVCLVTVQVCNFY